MTGHTADAAPFAYDAVPYPTSVNALQTPDRIRAAGLLHGWRAPDPASASILEIGCGDGYNLMGIAAAAPGVRCLGFDLSVNAIARGRDLLERSGLTNVELEQGDIAAYPLEGERFDYIICHGVYTWVPEAVRQPLLNLVGARLAPGGVAYIGFDALPAAAPKAAINRFLIDRLAGITELGARVAEAVRLLGVLARNQHTQSRLKVQLDQLMNDLPSFDPGYFVHDWLAEHYHPVTLADFRLAAGAAGLCCAGDAALFDLFTDDLDAEGEALVATAGSDAGVRSLVMEMLRGAHQFRRELLVRADAPPPAVTNGLTELSLAYTGERIESRDESGAPIFAYTGGLGHIVPRTPLIQQVLDTLLAVSPGELTVAELADRLGEGGPAIEDAVRRLATRGTIDAHGMPAAFTLTPGEHPRVGGLVRAMLATGNEAITLRHSKFVTDQEQTRAFLALCDGSRTRSDIARALSARFGSSLSVDKVDEAARRFAASRLFED